MREGEREREGVKEGDEERERELEGDGEGERGCSLQHTEGDV